MSFTLHLVLSTMEVQTSKKEIIEAMDSMCTVRLEASLG